MSPGPLDLLYYNHLAGTRERLFSMPLLNTPSLLPPQLINHGQPLHLPLGQQTHRLPKHETTAGRSHQGPAREPKNRNQGLDREVKGRQATLHLVVTEGRKTGQFIKVIEHHLHLGHYYFRPLSLRIPPPSLLPGLLRHQNPRQGGFRQGLSSQVLQE